MKIENRELELEELNIIGENYLSNDFSKLRYSISIGDYLDVKNTLEKGNIQNGLYNHLIGDTIVYNKTNILSYLLEHNKSYDSTYIYFYLKNALSTGKEEISKIFINHKNTDVNILLKYSMSEDINEFISLYELIENKLAINFEEQLKYCNKISTNNIDKLSKFIKNKQRKFKILKITSK